MTHWWEILFVPAIKRARRESSVVKCPYPEPCMVGAALYAKDQFNHLRWKMLWMRERPSVVERPTADATDARLSILAGTMQQEIWGLWFCHY